METLILARHGESEASARGVVNGDLAAGVALTAVGREQARALGELLRDEPIDLCVTSEFPRVTETAEIALAGREVPRLVVPDLNEIGFGDYEGRPLDDYRVWAREQTPDALPPGGTESRAVVVRRFVRGLRVVLARPERTILLVGHSLPLRYLLNAAEEVAPTPVLELVEYARAYRLSAEAAVGAVETLDGWCAAPSW